MLGYDPQSHVKLSTSLRPGQMAILLHCLHRRRELGDSPEQVLSVPSGYPQASALSGPRAPLRTSVACAGYLQAPITNAPSLIQHLGPWRSRIWMHDKLAEDNGELPCGD